MMAARILIVDDDDLLCEMLQAMLEMHGYAVAIAADGEAGLKLLAEQAIDLVILDLVMPRMDGLRFLRELPDRIANPPPILMASASATPQMQALHANSGVAGIIRKPVKSQILLETIETVLAKRNSIGA